MAQRVTVVGAGAWGTALALVAERRGAAVRLWARRADLADAISATRENRPYLPGIGIPAGVEATSSLDEACFRSDGGPALVILAIPSAHLATVAGRMNGMIAADCPVIVATKGIDVTTGRTMPALVADLMPGQPVALLSGPSFADEVARNLPTAVTLAAPTADFARRVVEALHGPTFRLYASDDMVGVALGGSIKNVIAIACGIAAGRELGNNARAALITRGLAETMRLATAVGARPETLMGLSGLGDLTLTCSSDQSRNFSLGRALGRGNTLADHQAGTRSAIEGVDAAHALARLAAVHRIDMPICSTVRAILDGGTDVDVGIRDLLDRPPAPDNPLGP